jgi:phosphoglycolate phosphatase-like HAD superfamily hydrolase
VYDAVILDNDGILVELVGLDRLHAAARTAFAECGVDDPADDDVAAMAIGVTPESLAAVCDRYGLDPRGFFETRDAVATRVQQAAVGEGVVGLYGDFDAVRSLAVPRGIVSSNQQATVSFHHDRFGTSHLFETIYGRPPTPESLRRKKPSPYYLRRALEDLGAENALFVGDSGADVGAAHATGIDSAFVRRPHRADYTLETEPTYELSGLDDLLAIDEVPVREETAT